eukprot:2781766-Rhodomonas_salina.2
MESESARLADGCVRNVRIGGIDKHTFEQNKGAPRAEARESKKARWNAQALTSEETEKDTPPLETIASFTCSE